jgi:hypothetical protein
MRCQHNVIDASDGAHYQSLFFSIDFDPIELRITSDHLKHLFELSNVLYGGYEIQVDAWNSRARTVFYRDATTYKISNGLNVFTRDAWQFIIDFVCDVLGKERRVVYSIRNERMLAFGDDVYEYICTNSMTTFWRYFLRTKTFHFAKYYEWLEILSKMEKDGKINTELNRHYDENMYYLNQQGLYIGKYYHEPKLKLIDQLIGRVKNG